MRRYGRYQILNEKWIVNLVKSMNNKKRRWDMFNGKKIKYLYEQLESLKVKNRYLEQQGIILNNQLEYNNIICVKYDSIQISKGGCGYEKQVKERLLLYFASKEIPRCNALNERVFTRAFTFPGLKEIKAEDIDIVIKEKSE